MLKDNVINAIRVSKSMNIELNFAEIANITHMSTKYLYNHNDEIITLYKQDFKSSEKEIESVISSIIENLLQESDCYKDSLGIIVGVRMRYQYGLLNHLYRLNNAIDIGKKIVSIFERICRYNNDNGAPLHSGDPLIKSLFSDNVKGLIENLFVRSDSYSAGQYSKSWKPTNLLEKVINKSLQTLIGKCIYNINITSTPYPSHMFLSKVERVSEQVATEKFITVPENVLKSLEMRSAFLILTNSVAHKDGNFITRIKHEASTDEQLGRSYNVFCQIRSEERLKIGYTSYDMNAAMQSICLQLLRAKEQEYPLLWNYSQDKGYKKAFRETIASDTGKTILEVKQLLTAYANGSDKHVNKHNLLKDFCDESIKLRNSVLDYVNKNDRDVLNRAIDQSRRDEKHNIKWADVSCSTNFKDKECLSSVFFFVWTWYERIIRQAMLTVLTDGIELHDAVYSKIDVDTTVVEKAILDVTGYHILIDKEHPTQKHPN